MRKEHGGRPRSLRDDARQEEVVSVEAKVFWKFQKTKSGQWVGTCDVLKSIVQSETFSELVEDIEQTMMALFADLDASGELDQLVQAQGWAMQRIPATGPTPEGDGSLDVALPVRYTSGRVAAQALH